MYKTFSLAGRKYQLNVERAKAAGARLMAAAGWLVGWALLWSAIFGRMLG